MLNLVKKLVIWRMTLKNNTTSSFVPHFKSISETNFKLQSGNTQFGSKLVFFVPRDLEIWWMTLKNNRAPLLCCFKLCASSWWRHQMETFSALLAICAGNSPVHGEFPAQRPLTQGFDIFFDVRPNKQLSKQSWGWWFETLSPSLCHRNDFIAIGEFKLELQSRNAQFGLGQNPQFF